jgi:MFS family permease
VHLLWPAHSHVVFYVRPTPRTTKSPNSQPSDSYGWTTHYHVHWIVPIIALIPFGIGVMGIFAPLQTYMIDCFPRYAASAIAGMTALRCLFGALLPLAGPDMYESLGLGWGNSLLGFVAIAFIPIPALLFRYGKTVRERWPVSV